MSLGGAVSRRNYSRRAQDVKMGRAKHEEITTTLKQALKNAGLR